MNARALAAITFAGSLAGAGAGGCGGAAREQARAEAEPFECRDRFASYVVANHMAGEIGVEMDCAAAGPRIRRWRTDRASGRQEDARSLPPGEFDRAWREIDGTGWPNLGDCTNGTAGKQDPIYVFSIKDDQHRSSFQCQSQAMPYPYHAIVDPLDLAAQIGRQLGNDEPAELERREQNGKRRP